MKFILSKLVIGLMLLATLKMAIPMSMGLGMAVAAESTSPGEINKQNATQNCHDNGVEAAKTCCYTGCDLKFTSFFFSLNTYQRIHCTPVFNAPAIDLCSVYIQPATPPPIKA